MFTCSQCAAEYYISEKLRTLLATISLDVAPFPLPSLCQTCRRMRRHAWQNERSLYRRECSRTGKRIVSVYSPDKPFPVYHHDIWASEEWNATDYGRRYDPTRSFFDQFHELQCVVPRKSINLYGCEGNCEFNNNLWRSKDTYLTFMSSECIDSYYNYASYTLRDCMDVWYSKEIELSYRIALGGKLYHCLFCERCDNSNDLLFCKRCRGCSHCFGCYGLRQKSYYLFNERVSKAEYERFLGTIHLGSYEALKVLREKVRAFFATLPQEAVVIDDFSEDCTGSFIDTSKNSEDCFSIVKAEDCASLFESARVKDCADLDFSYSSTLVYQANAGIGCYQCAFVDNAIECRNSYYLSQCKNVEDSFGCLGLSRKRYCLLNTQYRKDDYMALRTQVVEQMRAAGEWGNFFPLRFSDFGYNETDGALLLPKTREEIDALGGRWADYVAPVGVSPEQIRSPASIPERIDEVTDAICDEVFLCAESGKPFRFIPQEIALYRRFGLALPRVHPLARYQELIATRGSISLSAARCAYCAQATDSVLPVGTAQLCCRSCFASWQGELN